MIKVLRIGHATFETPDLAKAIEHYTQVIGLSLAGREDKRAFLATKIGQLAIELRQGSAGALQPSCRSRWRPNADFADLQPRVAEARRRGRGAQRFRPRPAQGAVVPGPQGHHASSCSANGATLGNHQQVVGVGALKLGHVAFVTPDPKALGRVLRARCWASASPTGSATSSCSCAATPTTMR